MDAQTQPQSRFSFPRGGCCVWGHYHGKNLGDDLVVSIILEALKNRLPGVDLYAVSFNPDDTSIRHGVPAMSIRGGTLKLPPPVEAGNPPLKYGSTVSSETPAAPVQGREHTRASKRLLKRIAHLAERTWLFAWMPRWYRYLRSQGQVYRVLRHTDVLVVAGSGPVCDHMGGAWVHPFNLFRWLVLSRLAGTRFVFLNVGAGPLVGRLSRRFVKWTLRWSDYRAVRNRWSQDLFRSLAAPEPVFLYCDTAFALAPYGNGSSGRDKIRRIHPKVGVSVMAYKDPRYWPDATPRVYGRYVDAMALLISRLLAAEYEVVMLKSHTGADRKAVDDVIARLTDTERGSSRLLDPPTERMDQLMNQVRSCDVVVGTRFHCHVIPLMMGIPVVGLSYGPKTDELMREAGLSEFCFPIEDFLPDRVAAAVGMLLDSRPEHSPRLLEQAAEKSRLLSEQFDELFGPRADVVRSATGDN